MLSPLPDLLQCSAPERNAGYEICAISETTEGESIFHEGYTYFFGFASGVDVSLPLRRLSPRHAPSDIKGCFTSELLDMDDPEVRMKM